MTPQDICTTARFILNDNGATYRQSDAELLAYVNDGLREVSVARPEFFSAIGDMTCDVGTVEQSLTFADAISLLEVLCVHEGDSLTPFDLDTMNAFNPGWRTDTAGEAQQWSRFANNPLRFYIYPKAPATSQVLDVRYVKNPTPLTAMTSDITEVPSALQPALVDYVVYRAESKDSEHVLSQRAQSHYQAFLAKLKG